MVEDLNHGKIRKCCPNYREKSRGFLKGCDRTCSCTGESLNYAYTSAVCTFYNVETAGKQYTYYIKYDECPTYKRYGIKNGG